MGVDKDTLRLSELRKKLLEKCLKALFFSFVSIGEGADPGMLNN